MYIGFGLKIILIYLINSSDGVLSTASKFADCVGLWLLLLGFPSWIFWKRIGLDRTQREPLAQRHAQRVNWRRRRRAKLAETVRGFWGALCIIRLIQDCMCPPHSHHSFTHSIHHWRRHADWAFLEKGSGGITEQQSVYYNKTYLIPDFIITVSSTLHRCEENDNVLDNYSRSPDKHSVTADLKLLW